jgi:hypothetical protein
MKQRCYNVKNTGYSAYGGRGIAVCDEWRSGFVPFRDWAMAHGYADNLSLDRINNDGDYTPDNCRWSTEHEQKRNRQQTHMISAFGETKCLEDWALDPRCTVTPSSLRHRLNKLGWDTEMAITMPRKSRKQAGRYPGSHV